MSHHLSSLFGKTSAAFEAFGRRRRALHGAHLGYRVVEALRNHVQHRGLPVSVSHRHWRSDLKDGSVERRTALRPSLMLRPLDDDRKFPRGVLTDLRKLDEENVELNPLIREWMKAMSQLQQHLRDAVDEPLQGWQAAIKAAVDEYRSLHGDDVLGLSALETDARGASGRHAWLGLEPTERLEELRKKNPTRPLGVSLVTEA